MILEQEKYLLCHTCCDAGPRYLRPHPKPHLVAFNDKQGVLRTCFNTCPRGLCKRLNMSAIAWLMPWRIYILQSSRCLYHLIALLTLDLPKNNQLKHLTIIPNQFSREALQGYCDLVEYILLSWILFQVLNSLSWISLACKY